jgi:septal ring factor EnvC (AmiA/AmiB activator)
MNWDLARLIWEIFVSLVAAGSCFVAWQASRSRVTQDQIEALDKRQDHTAQRLAVVETKLSHMPDAHEVRSLDRMIGTISGDLKALAAKMDGWGKAITRLERQTSIIDSHLKGMK